MGDQVEVTKTATKVTSNITLILYIQQSTVGVQLAALCYPYRLTLFTMIPWYYSGTTVVPEYQQITMVLTMVLFFILPYSLTIVHC